MFREHFEGCGQSSTLLTRFQQRRIKLRHPVAGCSHRFAESSPLLQITKKPRSRSAEPLRRRASLLGFKSRMQGQTRIRELCELMIEFSALGKPGGRGNGEHRASPPNQVDTRSSFDLKSRLLFRPTIWSTTCPPLKINSVGMARIPYSAAKACCSSVFTFP